MVVGALTEDVEDYLNHLKLTYKAVFFGEKESPSRSLASLIYIVPKSGDIFYFNITNSSFVIR